MTYTRVSHSYLLPPPLQYFSLVSSDMWARVCCLDNEQLLLNEFGLFFSPINALKRCYNGDSEVPHLVC